MRPWLRKLILAVVLAGIFVGAWVYANRKQLARQWACYRVGAADSFEEAQDEIAWFESGSDRRERLAELARKWGTGNQRFDLYLARHLHLPACSSLLREVFCEEFDRRTELLPRWAHHWSWRAEREPDHQVESILIFLDGRVSAEQLRAITWREVLDLRAIFQLVGRAELARGLSPANWPDAYRRWQRTRPAELPRAGRPAEPFADWQGPAAQRDK